ncbi:group XIIA secretory phospholipase A2 [Atheta coriaria]|uniref:group XIIA secretory phospholipase A2 n=1 Tax=Dalotia coriaria TaxID=877792 RepID=UPI0031F3E2F8
MELPWAKIFVYVLTVLGYVYSGWGSGLLNNIREAVISADSLFGGLFNNIYDVVNDINKFKHVFNSAGSEDECIFQCPNIDVMPVPNRNHKPSANGCGSIGMKINTEYLPAMTKCCDAHDICYDMCGSGKMECDRKFQQCLNNQCDGVSKNLGAQPGIVCNKFAQLLTDGISSIGCKFYLDAQNHACYCAPTNKESKKAKKFTKGSDL